MTLTNDLSTLNLAVAVGGQGDDEHGGEDDDLDERDVRESRSFEQLVSDEICRVVGDASRCRVTTGLHPGRPAYSMRLLHRHDPLSYKFSYVSLLTGTGQTTTESLSERISQITFHQPTFSTGPNEGLSLWRPSDCLSR